MYLPMVVGVDGSESSLGAVDWAADEAALHEVPLRIVHAYRWDRYEAPPSPGSSASRPVTSPPTTSSPSPPVAPVVTTRTSPSPPKRRPRNRSTSSCARRATRPP